MSRIAGSAWGAADAALPLAMEARVTLLRDCYHFASTSPRIGRILDPLLAPFLCESSGGPAAHRFLLVEQCLRHEQDLCIHFDGAHRMGFTRLGPLISWLFTCMNGMALEDFDGFAVHAGVISRDGDVIAFPAESGGGKTTLVGAAIMAGFEYVSDEALCVDFDSGQILAYPRPLVLSSWSQRALGLNPVHGQQLCEDETTFTPRQLKARIADPGVGIAHVVRPVVRPGPATLVHMARTDGLAWVLGNSFNHYKRPAQAFELAAALVREATVWRLEFSDPLSAAALLLDQLGPS
jgi:hypothetical protein